MKAPTVPARSAAEPAEPRILVEVCVETAGDAVAAAAGGADRIELNSALALDGLTPSAGLFDEVRQAVGKRIPIVAMARPRAGDFCYDETDFRVLLRDVEWLLDRGADGVAFGVLTGRGEVDVALCRTVMRTVESAGGHRYAVFHRAFDRVRNPAEGLDRLIDLGVRRVMTSGQEPTALRGARLIRNLVERAAGRIELLPAGGVRPSNVRAVVARTGCRQIHSSLRKRGGDRMDPRLLTELIRRIGQA